MRALRFVLLPAVLCTGVLALGPSPHARPAVHGSLTPVAATRVKIRIGTYNLNHDNSLATFMAAINRTLPNVDVVSFQELTGGTRQSQVATDLMHRKGWAVAASIEYGDVVVYRTARFKELAGSTAVMAEGRPVESQRAGALHFQRTIFGGITRLRDKSTGRLFTLVTAHPMAGAAQEGPHRPRLVAMYREIVTNLAQVASIQNRFARVYLVGDLNIDYFSDARHHTSAFPYEQFTRIGFQSMWAGARPSTGTRGRAVTDGVWARQRPVRRQVLAGFGYSDHKPVVATYWLP